MEQYTNEINAEINDNIQVLLDIKEQFQDENIPSNDDIDIAEVTFRVESSQMATANLTADMFC
jgi:hypothetical protein